MTTKWPGQRVRINKDLCFDLGSGAIEIEEGYVGTWNSEAHAIDCYKNKHHYVLVEVRLAPGVKYRKLITISEKDFDWL